MTFFFFFLEYKGKCNSNVKWKITNMLKKYNEYDPFPLRQATEESQEVIQL